MVAIHGTGDKVLPIAHAEALAAEVPGARLVVLEGAGHEIHSDDWPRIVAEIRGQRDAI